MQPYLFPYIGYFQLINASDKFLIADNVQYINKGWIARNRLLIEGKPGYFIFSVERASHEALINTCVWSKMDYDKKKFFKKVTHVYGKAPFFKDVFSVLENIFDSDEKNISIFIQNSLNQLCEYMKINTPVSFASEFIDCKELEKSDRIIEECQSVGVDHFINPIGGIELYSKEYFAEKGIKLNFLKTREIFYDQFGSPFVPDLSIIDVMMFNSKEEIQKLLAEYDLV